MPLWAFRTIIFFFLEYRFTILFFCEGNEGGWASSTNKINVRAVMVADEVMERAAETHFNKHFKMFIRSQPGGSSASSTSHCNRPVSPHVTVLHVRQPLTVRQGRHRLSKARDAGLPDLHTVVMGWGVHDAGMEQHDRARVPPAIDDVRVGQDMLELRQHVRAVPTRPGPQQIIPRRPHGRVCAAAEEVVHPKVAARPHAERARAGQDVVDVADDPEPLAAVERLVHVGLHRVRCSETGVRLAQKMPVGPRITVGAQLRQAEVGPTSANLASFSHV